MANPETWNVIDEYFKPHEFGDGAEEGMQDEYLISLTKFRIAIDNPMIIHPNGGFSTDGHSQNSYHYQGRAIDFHFKHNPVSTRRLVVTAIKCGLHGIGIYPHWDPKPGGFHIDNRPGGSVNIWIRNKAGVYIYLWTSAMSESLEEWRD